MKLLVVSAYFEAHRGGVERVAGHLVRGLAARGMHVTWLAADASSPPNNTDRIVHIAVRAWNGVQRALGVPVPIWSMRAVSQMRRAVRDSDVVMLHDTLYWGNIASYFAAKWAGKPVLIVQHVGPIAFSNPILRALMWLADRTIGRHMLRRADQVVFISQMICLKTQRGNNVYCSKYNPLPRECHYQCIIETEAIVSIGSTAIFPLFRHT